MSAPMDNIDKCCISPIHYKHINVCKYVKGRSNYITFAAAMYNCKAHIANTKTRQISCADERRNLLTSSYDKKNQN